jgi:hypothetical protein
METQRGRTTGSGVPGVDLSALDHSRTRCPPGRVGREGQQAPHRESSAGSVAEFWHSEGVPLLNAQAARALLRLLEGARERRQKQEERRKAS